MAGTTPKAVAIGSELRRAREDAGLSARQLADKLGLSHTTIGRWEKGERSPRPVDVATVLSALGADNALREELVELARDTDGSHWVATSLPEQQRQTAALLELERDATAITDVSAMLIPGLLQTGNYARAIMIAGGVPDADIETRVAVRLGRRDVITRTSRPASLSAFVDESALYRLIGGPQVMHEQLQWLLHVMEWPTVNLRVVPMSVSWHPGLEGAFVIVERGEGSAPAVQLETRRSSLFLHETADVATYQEAAAKVEEVAMSPEATSELIAEVINRLDAENDGTARAG
ncbi:helix-turn-helix domain-containing protein [Saccharopolyspora hirsuta]|uniref:Helix-turn-helix domain-containing protein n=1 Tax=Saccharopolyspora hirsuta TaxID=1837 RepID=A0A5M7BI00_SACHI|nr:helix-turn-helix transcriptional regulator [Saccharopolyspora hirsuta]KAA5829202.1 helix-turn-helix domain-containing protein [Saccharopolyspora hirsuta]